jgi:hypothetical protein
LRDFGGSQQTHEQEQQQVRRNMQIEVDQAVHQQSAASGPSAQPQRIRERIAFALQKTQPTNGHDAQKPSAAEPADPAGFGQSLQIIVVGVVHDFPVVKRS